MKRNTDSAEANTRKGQAKESPDWFGCGRTITTESWEQFKAARTYYYKRVDAAIAAGKPNDPLLGHPRP